MKKYLRSKSDLAKTSTSDGWAAGIGLILGLTIIGILSYRALDIAFFRPLAIGGLILVGVCIAFLAVVICVALCPTNQKNPNFRKEYSQIVRQADLSILKELVDGQNARSKIISIVDEHAETLARRRLILVKADHYGIVDGAEWNKEVQRFVDKVIRPKLSDKEATAIAPNMNVIFQELIEDRIRLRSTEIQSELAFPQDVTPEFFEQWCANTLNAHDWKAITTKASGDQGADVLAEKNGFRIILQCKLYSASVGNKAVQEAYAAQRHYGASAAAVVTNAEFTRSARDLANTTGVLLIHYGELGRLDSLLVTRNFQVQLAGPQFGKTP